MTQIQELAEQLQGLVHGIGLLRECSPRTRDAVLSFGERLSTRVLSAAARSQGIPTELIDARALIQTDELFGAATPDREATRALARDNLRPEAGKLIVTQGFIASTADNVTTTLGRGGSDFTATILGEAIGAAEVQIWTDVDGIMTADPRVIPGARTVDAIPYEEAAELAFFGAKVVHPSTIMPAVEAGIPVWVKNTERPDAPGTLVDAVANKSGIRAVATKRCVTVVTVHSSRMLNAYGFLRALFAVFEDHRVSVDLVATSEVSVSVTLEGDVDTANLAEDLRSLGSVTVEPDKSIVCLVGRDVLRDASFISRVFRSVAPTPVRMITLGSSDVNLSMVVPDSETEAVLRRLHEELF
jgi:aspartate kinase